MSNNCGSCEMLYEELDCVTSDLALYRAKEFIDFVASLGHPMGFYSSDSARTTKEDREFGDEFAKAYEICIAAYIHSTLTEQVLEIIALEAGEDFKRKIVDIYKRRFNRDPFISTQNK